MKNLKLPFTDACYEMTEPKVQRHGDVALLTFHLVNYGKLPNRSESVLARWNSTEISCRSDGKWKIIHSHWSYIQPELKQPGLNVQLRADPGRASFCPLGQLVVCLSPCIIFFSLRQL